MSYILNFNFFKIRKNEGIYIYNSDNIEIMGWDIPIEPNKKNLEPNKKNLRRSCSSPCSIIESTPTEPNKNKNNKKRVFSPKNKINSKKIRKKQDPDKITMKKLINTESNDKINYRLVINTIFQMCLCYLICNYMTIRYNQIYHIILCQNETIYNQDKLLEFIGDYTINHTRILVDEYNEHVFNIIDKELDNNLDDLDDINHIVNNEIDLNNYIETKLTPIENIIVDRNETLTIISKNRIFCKNNHDYDEILKRKLRDPKSMKMMISILYDLIHS